MSGFLHKRADRHASPSPAWRSPWCSWLRLQQARSCRRGRVKSLDDTPARRASGDPRAQLLVGSRPTEPARIAIVRSLHHAIEARAIVGGGHVALAVRVIPIRVASCQSDHLSGGGGLPPHDASGSPDGGGGYDLWGHPLRRGVVIVPRNVGGAEQRDIPPMTLLVAVIALAAAAAGVVGAVRSRASATLGEQRR